MAIVNHQADDIMRLMQVHTEAMLCLLVGSVEGARVVRRERGFGGRVVMDEGNLERFPVPPGLGARELFGLMRDNRLITIVDVPEHSFRVSMDPEQSLSQYALEGALEQTRTLAHRALANARKYAANEEKGYTGRFVLVDADPFTFTQEKGLGSAWTCKTSCTIAVVPDWVPEHVEAG